MPTRLAQEYIDAHGDELVSLLQALVQIPSVVTEGEGECQAFVEKTLRPYCDQVDVWEPDHEVLEKHPAYFQRGVRYDGRPNVIGIIPGTGEGRSLVLNAHVDVVAEGPHHLWPAGPWDGKIIDGKIHGRGAADCKAGLATALFLAKMFRELGIQLRGDLSIHSVVDEEWGGGGSLSAVLKGYTADGVVILEPTNLAICPGSRGGQTFRITVKGRGAHPVESHKGVSALKKAIWLMECMDKLEEIRQEQWRTELFEHFPIFVPLVIGRISAEEFPSKVPEKCIMDGLMGYHPQEEYQDARRELEEFIGQAARMDRWLREHQPKVEWLGLNKEGAEIPTDHPLVVMLADNFRRVVGQEPLIQGFPAGTDLPYYVRYGRMPTVLFGPGVTKDCHSINEAVAIDDLIQGAKILANFVIQWCTPA
ncbi:MAG: ArgE/DapE family deacylase [Firmicutes bacterium]|nr:ArgE/DapE family deacylase [Bacillota bacterium]